MEIDGLIFSAFGKFWRGEFIRNSTTGKTPLSPYFQEVSGTFDPLDPDMAYVCIAKSTEERSNGEKGILGNLYPMRLGVQDFGVDSIAEYLTNLQKTPYWDDITNDLYDQSVSIVASFDDDYKQKMH